MVIDSGNNLPANSGAGKARQSSTNGGVTLKTSDDQSLKQTGKSSDSVSLSSAGKSLAQLEAKVSSSPEVDIAKVDAVKAAIANGTYNIDDTAIAIKLLTLDKLF